jgi:pentatricopeptide repeat protein
VISGKVALVPQTFMFECSACLRRFLTSYATPYIRYTPPSTRPIYPESRSLRRTADLNVRRAATLRALKKPHHRRDALETLKNSKALQLGVKGRKKRDVTKSSPGETDVPGLNQGHMLTDKGLLNLQRQADKEAQWLVDPLKLSETVVANLRDDNYQKAYQLVLASDRHGLKEGLPQGAVKNVVSWNHLIDYCMANKKPKEAWSLYQEMKKRGHEPDAHTVTIILRGLLHSGGWDAERPAHLKAQALSIYQSLSRPNSKVKPSTIHTNAMLNICAKYGDMDGLWSIAGKLPTTGPGQADSWTYTIIFNAMRADLEKQLSQGGNVNGVDEATFATNIIDRTINDARQLWVDIIARWRRADLDIDEKLVFALGRLLLISKRQRDHVSVFDLVRQTCNVHVTHSSLARPQQLDEPDAEATTQVRSSQHEDADSDRTMSTSVAFGLSEKGGMYVKPGAVLLNLVMEAALVSGQRHVGKMYWRALTSDTGNFKVVPDTPAALSYLRVLRVARASKEVVDVFLSAARWGGDVATLAQRRNAQIIALSACMRDKNNPNVFATATRLLDIFRDASVDSKLETEQDDDDFADQSNTGSKQAWSKMAKVREHESMSVSPKVLVQYLDLAKVTTRGIAPHLPLSKTKTGDLNFERDPRHNNLIQALQRIGLESADLKRAVTLLLEQRAHAVRSSRRTAGQNRQHGLLATTGEKAEVIFLLLRSMVSAYDKLLSVNFQLSDEGLGGLDRDIVSNARFERARMSAHITRLVHEFPEVEAAASGEVGEDGVEEEAQPQKKGRLGSVTRIPGVQGRRLSRRQKQEAERERRADKLRDEMVETGLSASAVVRQRREAHEKKRSLPRIDQDSLWGRRSSLGEFHHVGAS